MVHRRGASRHPSPSPGLRESVQDFAAKYDAFSSSCAEFFVFKPLVVVEVCQMHFLACGVVTCFPPSLSQYGQLHRLTSGRCAHLALLSTASSYFTRGHIGARGGHGCRFSGLVTSGSGVGMGSLLAAQHSWRGLLLLRFLRKPG